MKVVHAAFEAVAAAVPPCLVKTFAGLPCPTCGAARAARALLEGDVVAAVATNPAFVAAIAAAPALAVWVARTPPGPWPPRRLRLSRALVLAAVGANWAYLVAAGV